MDGETDNDEETSNSGDQDEHEEEGNDLRDGNSDGDDGNIV